MSRQYFDEPVKRQKVYSARVKETRFVKSLQEGNNQSQAVIDAGYNVKDKAVASVMGNELLKRPSVLALLNSKEEEAEEVIVSIMTRSTAEDKDRLNAAKLLLAYTRGNPVSRNENINVTVSLEDILSSDSKAI